MINPTKFAMITAVVLLPAFFAAIVSAAELEPIVLSADGQHFVGKSSGKVFKPWGFNYLGKFGTLYEEHWAEDWQSLEEDFQGMKELGANVVRVHLQVGTYQASPTTFKTDELARLRKLLDLAEKNGIYLDVTGLSCYHPDKNPPGYDELSEEDRWKSQALFWDKIAETCAGHPAVFCYCLMNEPVIQDKPEKGHPWLGGDLEGFYFVQRISNAPGKRDHTEIVEAWVKQMTTAIRAKDPNHLITVGVIPWIQFFPKASRQFYEPGPAKHLDFVAVHFYPKTKEIEQTLVALKAYDIGKPIVVEETAPLTCSQAELEEFIDGAKEVSDGWISHYFGKTPAEERAEKTLRSAIVAEMLERWKKKGEEWKKKGEEWKK